MDIKSIKKTLPTRKFSAIIGTNPSQGARSPLLWNRVYSFLESGIRMVPIDVEPYLLNELLEYLESEKNFIGGAIAVPYKKNVYEFINRSNQGHKIGGAYNCVYRGSDGTLSGANTDGKAAVRTIEGLVEDDTTEILVLGCGGVAHGVVSEIIASRPEWNVWLSCRNVNQMKVLGKSFGIEILSTDELSNEISRFKVLVNCTSAGSFGQERNSALSLGLLSKLKSGSKIFDVVYQPEKTKLLVDSNTLGLKTVNGLKMNLDQAVIAFEIVNRLLLDLSNIDIHGVMSVEE